MRTFYAFAGLALLVLGLDHRWAQLAAAAAVVVVAWRIDVAAHPLGRCRKCKGTGMNPGSRPGAYGLCTHGPRRARRLAKKAAARHLRRGRA